MGNIKHALVLTGDIAQGFDAATVWPALAAYFRMDPERLRAELLSRAPISIKESDDLAKLQNLQAGAAALGAHTELHALGDEGSLFVLVENAPRGPVPHSFVDDRVRSGIWPSSLNVAAVGSANWRPFIARATLAPIADQATVAMGSKGVDSLALPTQVIGDLRAANPAPAAAAVFTSTAQATSGLLPEGEVIHAGFWRRFAANMADSFILGIVSAVLMSLIAGVTAALVSSDNQGAAFAMGGIGYILLIVLSWLYFAKLESSAGQATPGKRLMGIKVTDDKGQRIGFGRATGRFFGKIISGMIFNIGYMLAGWTGRKQALHDMMAGTCVVFDTVQPGQPLPSVRPPMPWYGWVLNILPFVLTVLAMLAWGVLMSMLLGLANG